METLTLETFPKVVNQLCEDVAFIKRHLLAKVEGQPEDADRWFDLNELCNYLPDKPAKPTVYGWVHAGLIPCHKGQKKLRFLKSEIDHWLKQGRKKTLAEAAAEADVYLKRKGGCHA